jgi:hypothetical protein
VLLLLLLLLLLPLVLPLVLVLLVVVAMSDLEGVLALWVLWRVGQHELALRACGAKLLQGWQQHQALLGPTYGETVCWRWLIMAVHVIL